MWRSTAAEACTGYLGETLSPFCVERGSLFFSLWSYVLLYGFFSILLFLSYSIALFPGFIPFLLGFVPNFQKGFVQKKYRHPPEFFPVFVSLNSYMSEVVYL